MLFYSFLNSVGIVRGPCCLSVTRFTASDCIRPRFFNCIWHSVKFRVRVETPSLLCVKVSLLKDSVRYHADAIRCSGLQSDAVNRVTCCLYSPVETGSPLTTQLINASAYILGFCGLGALSNVVLVDVQLCRSFLLFAIELAYCWTLSSKFFSTFPHSTCSLSVSCSCIG